MFFLISEIQKRTVLWNKWDEKIKNPEIIDKEWESVAKEVGLSKNNVKRKWRNLRDQFLKELKKIPSNCSGSSNEYVALYKLYKGKWSYFHALLFLKDSVMPRKTDGNATDISDIIKMEVNDKIDNIRNIVIENQLSEQNVCTDDTCTSQILSPSSISYTTTQKKNKRPKKLAALTELPASTDDEDMHFFKSILPYFKTMGPIQKLRVRNDIQNILIRESLPPQQCFDTTNFHNQNYIFPTISTLHSTYSSTPSPSTTNFHYSDDTI